MAFTPPKYVMVRLPRELSQRVDETRPSTTSREAFVREAVEAALGDGREAVAASRSSPGSSPSASPRASTRPTNAQIAAATGHHEGCRCLSCYDISTGRTPIA